MAGAGGVRAGRAFVELFVQDKKLRSGLTSSETRLQLFAKRAKAAGAAAAKFGVAAGTAAAVGLFALAKQTAEAGDKIEKMGERTGASAEFLSTMAFAAEQSGTNIETLGNALFRMTRRVANATTATGPAKRALEELGLVAADLDRLNTDEKFFAIVRALDGVESPGRRAQLAFELFGEQAKALTPLLNQGEAGIKALQAEAIGLGRQMSGENVKAAAAFNDQLNRMTSEARSLGQTLGFAILPALTEIIAKFSDGLALLAEWELTLARIKRAVLGGILGIGEALGDEDPELRRGLDELVREAARRRGLGGPAPRMLEQQPPRISVLAPPGGRAGAPGSPAEGGADLDDVVEGIREIDEAVTSGLTFQ